MQTLHSQEQVKVKSSKLAQKKQESKPHLRRTALHCHTPQPCRICFAAVLAALTAVVTAAGNAVGNARSLGWLVFRVGFPTKISAKQNI